MQVRVGGLSVDPPDAGTWQLLALLAVYADHVVAPHVMMEELWPDEAPPGALSEVHRRVKDLQSRLARADACAPRDGDAALSSRGTGGSLAAVPGGYRLDCAHATVDVRQFWRDSGAGFRALAADDVRTAAQRLGSALRLWTGDALADMPLGPRLNREVEQLSAARARAEEQWLEAEQRLRSAEAAVDAVGVAGPDRTREAFRRPPGPSHPRLAVLGTEAAETFERRDGAQRRPWVTGWRPYRASHATALRRSVEEVGR